MPGHGSKKQAQRTKGNTRPSSSSHAAQLLSATGSVQPGFVGFGNLSGIPGYVPASQALDDMDSSLDSDFRMTLRKLTKRDSTTKVKALQELSVLCKEKSDDSLKAVLPFWPRMYNKMCLDIDYRVREAAQQAMNTLVARVRKNLAPYLKSMMGSWLLSQCDTYPTVSSGAAQAFQTAFPPAKQTDALIFCKQETLEYLVDNIVNQTPGTLSDQKSTEPEDMQNKYNRVLTSSLLAMRKLITTIPANQQEDLKEQLKGLLDDPKFWKHGKSSVVSIRGAMFSSLSGLCQSQPELSAHYTQKISPLILGSIGDKDPVISPAVWEAALSVVSHIKKKLNEVRKILKHGNCMFRVMTVQELCPLADPRTTLSCTMEELPSRRERIYNLDCWKSVNVEKAFWPKFRSLLENGCYGNASLIGPDLLPFISRIPSDLLGTENKFYEEFCNYFKLGFSKDLVHSSTSECSALIKAYIECTQWIIKQAVMKKEDQFARCIIHDQILPIVQCSLFDSKSTLSRSPLYGMMGNLFETLERTESENTNKAVTEFWTGLADDIDEKMSQLSQIQEHEEKLMERITHLVKCLIYPQHAVKVKSEKVVMFSTNSNENSDTPTLSERTTLSAGAGLFVQKVTLKAFKMAHEHWSPANLQLFAQLIELEPADDTIRKVIECCHGDIEGDQSHSSYFVFNVLLPWLGHMQSSAQEGADPRQLITVICTFMPLLEKESNLSLLQQLCESITSNSTFLHLMEKTMNRRSKMSAIQEWLHSGTLGNKLVLMVQSVCTESIKTSSDIGEAEIQHGWDILTLILSSADDNGAPVISKDTVQNILQIIHQTLIHLALSEEKNKANTAVMFVSKATKSFFLCSKDCLMLPSAGDLLLALFTVSLDNSYHTICTDDTLQECENAWTCGLGSVVSQTGGLIQDQGILQKMTSLIKDKVVKTEQSQMFGIIMANVDKVLQILRNNLPGQDDDHGGMNPVISEVITELYVSKHFTPSKMLLEYMVLSGDLTFREIPAPESTNIEQGLAQILYCTLYNMKLLSICKNVVVPSCENQLQQVELTDNEVNVLLDIVYGLAVVEKWKEMDKMISRFPDLLKTLDKMELGLSTFINYCTKEVRNILMKETVNRLLESGSTCMWSSSLNILLEMFSKSSEFTLDLSPLLDRCSNLSGNEVQLLQVCAPYLDNQNCISLCEIMVARIMTCPMDSFSDLSVGIRALAVFNRSLLCLPESRHHEALDLIKGAMAAILIWKEQVENLLLFESSITESDSETVFANCELIRFIQLAVRLIPKQLVDKEWDFVMCSCVSFIQSVEESQESILDSLLVQMFTSQSCRLLAEIADCMHKTLSIDPSAFPSNLATEWKEFFSASAYATVLPLFVRITGDLRQKDITGSHYILLSSLAKAVSSCPKDQILAHKLQPYFIAGQLSPLPDTLQTLLNHFCPLLSYKDPAVQIGVFHMLEKVMPELPVYDKNENEPTSQNNTVEQTSRSPPDALMDVLKESAVAMDIMLTDIKVEQCLEVQPTTEEYQFTLAYLLTWKLLVIFFRSAPAELRQQYAAHFREEGMVRQLMSNIFCLMLGNPPLTPDGKTVFEKPTALTVTGKPSSEEIEHIACTLYLNTLRTMPAMVRQWWIEQDRKTSAYIDKFTTKHVSQLLCNAEIQSVPKTDLQLENMTIRARPATREVIATYSLEEVVIEILICLPQNYPLGNITVQSEKRVGVSAAQWDKWLLQLNIFLQHQNGSIIDGLRLWKQNIDKRFEGADDCMICYSVLHGTNFQLPRMLCKTCKKKFHSACLYKWFQTSHNSTCPLCRNLF